MSRRRAGPPLPRRAALLLALAAAACSNRQANRDAPEPLPSLTYDYLPPIRLNVASIDIDQRFGGPPAPGVVTTSDQLRPAEAIARMARDRLQAVGPSGRAVFVITDATVLRGPDAYQGSFAVELDIYTSANVRAAFAEARVAGRRTIVDGESTRRGLYELTKQLLDQLNVEFEFQVRRSMRDWLVASTTETPPSTEALNPTGPPASPDLPAPITWPAPVYAPAPADLPPPGNAPGAPSDPNAVDEQALPPPR